MKAIKDTRTILGSTLLASVMNHRDKHLAHSLERTYREKHAAIAPMKYGDETKLLNASIPIVERLHCSVNGKSFQLKIRRK